MKCVVCYKCRSNIEEAGHVSLHIGVNDVAVVLAVEERSGRHHRDHSRCTSLPLD